MNGTWPLEILSDLGRRHTRPATAVAAHHFPMGPTCTT
ncbi:hypothetical protein CU044_5728 [Streptomyces sp. L-9-10]|nr:hypothetical protein CU044_5728 [Streptomyces sp. L-9-10]